MKLGYKATLIASFTGYVVQAITINFSPLLYLTFQTTYDLSIPQISSLIAVCFAIQMITDALAAKFADKLHPRATTISAHLLAAIGIGGFGFQVHDLEHAVHAPAVCLAIQETEGMVQERVHILGMIAVEKVFRDLYACADDGFPIEMP